MIIKCLHPENIHVCIKAALIIRKLFVQIDTNDFCDHEAKEQ